MAIPILIIQRGNSSYLSFCLHQARHHNPQSEIILIGNRSNNKYPFVRHYHLSGYSFNANLFAKANSHLQAATGDSSVKMWFKHWFILRDFMQKHRHGEQFLYINSNVLLYCNATKEFEKFKDYSMTLCGDRDPHCTFFNTSRSLEDFCDLIIKMQNKPEEMKTVTEGREHSISENRERIVDEITVVSEYRKQHSLQVCDISAIINNTTFEDNLGEARGYEFDDKNRLKKIYWKDGFPYGKHVPGGNLVKFNALHFAGHAKSVMHRYYTGKNLHIKKFFSEMRHGLNGVVIKRGK